ncbi:hypothetical protein D3C86_2151570 [compost metagenome]
MPAGVLVSVPSLPFQLSVVPVFQPDDQTVELAGVATRIWYSASMFWMPEKLKLTGIEVVAL